MIVYPAIDILDGRVVRLRQGRAEDCTVYSDDPVGFAMGWKEGGAQWLHVVDLSGAFAGEPRALELAGEIASATGLCCQFGGGIRSLAHVMEALSLGVRRVIIGSKAVESPDFLLEAVSEFGGESLAVGIDAKDGFVAVHGWVEVSEVKALDFAKMVLDEGVRTIIYTDISTDGMLKGPNVDAMREMREAVPEAELIASGGVSCLGDLRALKGIRGLNGVIVGRALFDGIFSLEEALKVAREE
jgi:phosphoribosylformimino-5-aminoimidazole carboxamide ribotide isomerase